MISRITGLFLLLTLLGAAPLAAQTGELRDLNSLDELKTQFNLDAGIPRIVLLLSPT